MPLADLMVSVIPASKQFFNVAGSLVLVVCLMGAQDPPADKKYQFDIRQQNAESALNAVADKTGFPLLFLYDEVKQVSVTAVRGEYTVQQVLNRLLSESGLVGVLTDDGVITISALSQPDKNHSGIKESRGFLATLFGFFTGNRVKQETDKVDITLAGLEEVIVTAQRRDESWQAVPISVQVATGSQLENSSIDRLEDLGLIAPAVQISRIGVFTQPSIRGVTTYLAGSYENNVATYIDGYYLPFTRGLNADMTNVSQVQILKGPQGTLFGRNTTGGAILVETLSPSMTKTEGRLKASYGRFNEQLIQAYFSTPINDTLAWNFAVSSSHSDGYIKDVRGFDSAPMESYDAITKLRWEPSDKLSATLKYEALSVEDGRSLALTYEGRSLARALLPEIYLEQRDNRTSLNFPVENITHQHNTSLNWDYEFGWALVTSNTSLQRESNRLNYDLDGTSAALFAQQTHDRGEAISQDINLTTLGEGKLKSVFGFYYLDVKRDALNNISLSVLSENTSDYLPGQLNNSGTLAFAGYIDLTYQIADKIFLSGGVRYSDETQKLRVACPMISDNCVADPWVKKQENFDGWTSRAVLRYELDSYSSAYFSFSQGFKSGLINLAPPFNRVEPEKINAFEVGYKSLNDRWQLDLASYFYDYSNLQVSALKIIDGNNLAVTSNAAEADIYGAEVQLKTKLGDNLNLNLGLAYTHARYSDFPFASYNEITPAGLNTSTCSTESGVIPCTQDWSGQRITRAPDWTGNLGAEYTFRSVLGKFILAGNLFYTSEYTPLRGDLYSGTSNFRYDQGDYSLLNLRFSWQPAKLHHLKFTIYGDNVTDEKYYFYRSGNVFGDYHVLGQPITYGAIIDYIF